MWSASRRGLNALVMIAILPNLLSVIATVAYTKAKLERTMGFWLLYLRLCPPSLRDRMHFHQVRSPFSIKFTLMTCAPPSDSSSTPPPKMPAPCKEEHSTFHDILPSEFITTSTLSKNSQSSVIPPKTCTAQQNFVKSVRKSLLPKMQDVVLTLRRSVTSIRRTRPTFPEEMRKTEHDETQGLVRSDSSSSLVPDTPRRSKTIATSWPRSKYLSS